MRAHRLAIAAGLGVAILGLGFSSDVLAQQGRAGGAGARGAGAGAREGGAGPRILERATTEKAVPLQKAKLEQYFKDMDAAKEETLRMVEGGQFNVNIRRIKKPEAAPLIHPKTIDVWYVLEGSGSVVTGGTFANGKVTGGVTDNLTPGDVLFVPANLPHWMNTTGPNGITWLNVRWDVDWKGPMGAGNPPVPGMAGSAGVGEFATTTKAVYIPKALLESYIAEQNATKSPSSTKRMIEGGHFNVNIRNVTESSSEFHERTIDTWVVLAGSGTAITGYSTAAGGAHVAPTRGGAMTPNTGVEVPVKVGDVMFVPSNMTHGFSKVDGRVVWLNIRWDSNY
jgi:mannose-6-phosphate isomerase-like protein (cupin superfamily)